MNLSLGFPESQQLSLRRSAAVDAVVTQFEARQRAPGSPVRAIRKEPAREGDFRAIPEAVSPILAQVLAARGIDKLYSHQADAFNAVESGRHVVVVTPTASGKTLCYNLPILNSLLSDPGIRALCLFPTKALAEDQLSELKTTIDASGAGIGAHTYDGDTPQDARKTIRERANIILTNPDMLHSGILPHHTRWAKCFERLRYVVIDELHYYRGIYGSHLANILRRLKRICEFYGSSPQFICCSATIANPAELAKALTESPVECIDSNGAPSGDKYFIFYNPPMVNHQLGIRKSYLGESRRIAGELISHGHQTLVFANNRLATEVLLTYLKHDCERRTYPPASIRGYRGGYLPRERREIERELREGRIRGVVATNALELGIDIGSLDCVVMAGYPGTIASTWQRAGRAGRRNTTSVALLVASSNPLDQFIVEHPDYFFGQSAEQAYINPDNLEILLNHLKCAAFELPIRDGEKFGPHATGELCRFLAETGVLHHSGECWHWTSDTYPADAISLRAVTSDNFVVVDTTSESQVIAEVSFPMALTSLHEKAIYLHEARQYEVERFDYENRKAYVRRVDCEYYTDAIDYTQVKILEQVECSPLAPAMAAHGDVRVNRQIVGFKKIKFHTNENVGAGNLSMPEQEMHTTSFWLHFPASFFAPFEGVNPTERQDGLAGAANVLRSVAGLLLMCDPRDLGVAVTEDNSPGAVSFEPDLHLYDNFPGGIGQSAPLLRMAPTLVSGARQVVEACPCEAGCPSCVGPAKEAGSRGKEIALRILKALSGGQPTDKVA